MKRAIVWLTWTFVVVFGSPAIRAENKLLPQIDGNWWTVATSPDIGELTNAKQEPVDFAIWQAADGTWQIWSCIRNTKEIGATRLFFRWEGANLTNSNWKPMGIAMRADPMVGENPGGLQAPFVFHNGKTFCMTYGSWDHICLATGTDGKNFTRHLGDSGETGLFTEGIGNNSRDPMILRIGNLWHCYYTAYPNKEGKDFCRTSKDLLHWSKSQVVAFGGQSGTGQYSAECPFVVEPRKGEFFLFRTQRYGANAQTSVYSSHDPLDFGVNQDEKHLLGTLPVAAPEIIFHEGNYYIAALLPDLKGIRIAKLRWEF